ncbi:L-carnitine dehydrogenase [Roseimaritima multifibrata]|uniref:L-gulonate 3-dehydrogenase n=1 Tax=Roseimaritima multifibrata TaxID=1930274 RepID=A0A517MMX6_9BACT|nr:3-hydroxyacyl-CoA dehydrogenase NAD-binding domain-containing protein [Roseimaritima multifibrata]QDS96230.1 L-carnitine dehydrogenase [Roseimaritima multifibrata]
MLQNIAILGCGLIGSSWATWFALQGQKTRLYDVDQTACERGVKRAGENLRRLVDLDMLAAEDLQSALQNLQPVKTLQELLSDCDYVQESVREDYDTKAEVYRAIEQHLSPQAIIASSSSGLLMSKMQEVLKHPSRSLIAHPFNPPHLIPLVELVPGKKTSADTVTTVREFFLRFGKRPVVLNKEVPGHIANRLAAAVWREALALLDDDVASLEDIDAALCNGPGLRWALMGQHAIYDLGGGEGGYQAFIDGIGRSFTSYWEDMQTWTRIPESAREKAIAGIEPLRKKCPPEERAQWRDEKLVRLLKLLDE